MTTLEEIKRAGEELDWIRAGDDCGAVPHGLYALIKKLEVDISWADYRRRERTLTRAIQRAWSIKP
jgi:hypothetical protein